MKNQEDLTVKRPSSGLETRCPKSARLEEMDTSESDHNTKNVTVNCVENTNNTNNNSNKNFIRPVDLSNTLVKDPNSNNNHDSDSETNNKTVLKVPTSLRFGTSAPCDIVDNSDLHQMLSKNLAQQIAARNEKIKREFFFGQTIAGLSNGNGGLGVSGDVPHHHDDIVVKKQEALSEIFQPPPSIPKCSSDEMNIERGERGEIKEEPHNQAEVKKEIHEDVNLQDTSARVTSFTVQDILDPHKFTGRIQDDEDDLERGDDDEDNTYISGEKVTIFLIVL